MRRSAHGRIWRVPSAARAPNTNGTSSPGKSNAPDALHLHDGTDEDAPDYEIADVETSPVDAVESGERSEIFWKAFRTLSAKDREILSLRHFDELAYKEIAEALSIPEGTVMSRLFHARRRLREELEKIPGGPR